MFIELAGISVAQRSEEQFEDALESLVGAMQTQTGCLGCRLLKSSPREKWVYVLARWETQKDLIRHLQSEIYKKLILLMELSTAPPVLEFYSVLEISGLDLVEAARSVQE
ncbi:MAG TPA: antibiotic biosynthesis monooxygenase family protein [Verrucomicrobiae bacterium]|nr:antibiotic biosynthesis monooxygenase family protein [Verrucomicrobiae bacterium]